MKANEVLMKIKEEVDTSEDAMDCCLFIVDLLDAYFNPLKEVKFSFTDSSYWFRPECDPEKGLPQTVFPQVILFTGEEGNYLEIDGDEELYFKVCDILPYDFCEESILELDSVVDGPFEVIEEVVVKELTKYGFTYV